MTKTLTCKELGGVCDATFSGETFTDVMNKGIPHMMGDDAHKAAVTDMEKTTGETGEQWTARMQGVFDAKPADA